MTLNNKGCLLKHKTMNSELIRIDVKMCQAFNIRPDVDRIARADGKTDARRD